jgi:hypothetical protein
MQYPRHTDKRAKHVRVTHKPGGPYVIANHQLNSLQELVTKFGTALNLHTPCPGSKYQPIFAGAAPDFGEYMNDLSI